MADRINLGIIGCGHRVYHLVARMLELWPKHLRITALAEPGEANRRRALTLNPDAAVCEDHRDLVARPEIDWVLIGSLNNQHREHAIAALEAGKHVFCEKPLGTTMDDLLAIQRTVQQSDRRFAVGFTLRYSPWNRKLKQILDDGLIGDPISFEFNETLGFNHGGMIHGNWRRFTRYAGSHLLEKCCHDFDVVHWMIGSRASRVGSFGGCDFFTPRHAGEISRIGPDARGRTPFMSDPRQEANPFTAEKDIVDNQVAIIEYDSGVRATFHTNCCAAMPERRLYICGTRGTARLDQVWGRLEVARIGWDEPITEWPDMRGSGEHGGCDDILCRELAECMLHDREPAAGLEAGLVSAITVFAVDDAMATGQVVDVEPYWQRVGLATPNPAATRPASAAAAG